LSVTLCTHTVHKPMKRLFIIGLFMLSMLSIYPQEVYHHISNTSVYRFLDELANQQIIDLNSVVKPYSRKFIAERLSEAYEKREELSNREQKELNFYLKDFNKELKPGKNFKKRLDLYYYKDSLFIEL